LRRQRQYRADDVQFWLGTHLPNWLGLVDVPLMVTVRRLKDRRTFPRARAEWWQDSNGYTQLAYPPHCYTSTPREYVAQTRRHAQEIGNLTYVSPQDWMCEPNVLAQTGLSVQEHQLRTIQSFLDLRELAPELPWVPVLQGWAAADYLRHIEQYARAGIDLVKEKLVGVGTVCRRQGTHIGADIFKLLSWCGLRLHGFGFKVGGIRLAARYMCSGDSMAWSYAARRERAQCAAGLTHKNCANCLAYALAWREQIVSSLP
jgi:hypothetical protein